MQDYIFFLPNLARGGVARTVACLAEGLSTRRINVIVVVLHDQIEQLNELQPDKIRCLLPGIPVYAKALLLTPVALIRLFKLLKARPGATVSAHGLFPNLMLAVCKLILGGRLNYIGFQHDSPSGHYTSASGWIKKRILQWSYRKCEMTICVSQGVADELVKERISAPGKAVVLHNGHDLSRIRDLSSDTPSPAFRNIRSKYSGLVLMIGRLAAQKDYVTAIRVAQELAPENVAIAVIGDGPELNRLQRIVEEARISNFYLLGPKSNPFPELASSDLLLLTSLHESFGNVIVEALALGKSVVSTDCPSGPREILDGGRYGVLCPIGDSRALTEAVRQTIGFCAREPHLHRNDSLQRAENFDVKRQVSLYLELLGLQHQKLK